MDDQPATPVHGEGMAVAALATGLVGLLFGLLPPFFILAWVLGLLALVFGFVGMGRGRPRRRMAGTGAFLGAASIVMGVVGAVLLFTVVTGTVVDAVKDASDGIRADLEEYLDEVESDIGGAIDDAERDLIDEVERELSG